MVFTPNESIKTNKAKIIWLCLFFACFLNQNSLVLIHQEMAAINAEAGIVKIHAHTMLLAMPQFTEEKRRVDPTPTIAPVMVCVVDTGMPKAVAVNKVIAPPVSAQKPPTGLSFVSFCPMVLTMRQPPNNVPNAIAAKQL